MVRTVRHCKRALAGANPGGNWEKLVSRANIVQLVASAPREFVKRHCSSTSLRSAALILVLGVIPACELCGAEPLDHIYAVLAGFPETSETTEECGELKLSISWEGEPGETHLGDLDLCSGQVLDARGYSVGRRPPDCSGPSCWYQLPSIPRGSDIPASLRIEYSSPERNFSLVGGLSVAARSADGCPGTDQLHLQAHFEWPSSAEE